MSNDNINYQQRAHEKMLHVLALTKETQEILFKRLNRVIESEQLKGIQTTSHTTWLKRFNGKSGFRIKDIGWQSTIKALEIIEHEYISVEVLENTEKPEFIYFFNLLKHRINHLIEQGQEQKKYFSSKFHIPLEEVNKFLTVFPAALFSHLDDLFEKECNTPLYHYSSQIDVDLFEEVEKGFEEYQNTDLNFSLLKNEGLVLGHALSPYSDSIALLYELGRFKRVSELLNTKSKIFLTSPKWAEMNYTVAELTSTLGNRKVKDNLEECYRFRKKIYSRLGWDGILLDDRDVSEIKSKYDAIKTEDIERHSHEYSDYASFFYPNSNLENSEKQLQEAMELLRQLCEKRPNPNLRNKIRPELIPLSFSIVDDKKNLFVIQTILKHFKATDVKTFRYTLFQRYVQHYYSQYLKIGVETEKRFDIAFAKLDKVDRLHKHSLGAIYFPNYFFSTTNSGAQTVIPYTFPSGTLWQKSKESTANIVEALDSIINKVILLWDFDTIERQEKVYKLMEDISLSQLAVQMSDLFCFVNYFFKDDKDFWPTLFFELGQLSEELVASWKKYHMNNEIIEDFSKNFMQLCYEKVTIPFYFYPYILSLRSKNDTSFDSFARKKYASIVLFILEKVFNSLNIEEWQ